MATSVNIYTGCDSLKALIAAADVNIPFNNVITPLMMAVRNGAFKEAILILLKAGANINQRDLYNNTVIK